MTFHRQVKGIRGPHPPYSPDLAPCDFFLFPKLKAKLRGTRFPNLDELQTAVLKHLDAFTPADFEFCFQELQDWWLRCITADGSYFEGHGLH